MKTQFFKDSRTALYFQMVESIENETNEMVLDELSSNKIKGIRILVAMNPNTTVETLQHLFLDTDPLVREAVILNAKFDKTTFVKLGQTEKLKINIFSFLKYSFLNSLKNLEETLFIIPSQKFKLNF